MTSFSKIPSFGGRWSKAEEDSDDDDVFETVPEVLPPAPSPASVPNHAAVKREGSASGSGSARLTPASALGAKAGASGALSRTSSAGSTSEIIERLVNAGGSGSASGPAASSGSGSTAAAAGQKRSGASNQAYGSWASSSTSKMRKIQEKKAETWSEHWSAALYAHSDDDFEIPASKYKAIKSQSQQAKVEPKLSGEAVMRDDTASKLNGKAAGISASTAVVEDNKPSKGKGKAVDPFEDEDADLWDAMEAIGPPRTVDGEPVLSDEQRKVHDMIVHSGKSLMFTGGAGTGKSVLLRAVVKSLRAKYGEERVGICAMTGIAALHVGGQTLHSWAGIGLGNQSAEQLVANVRRGKSKGRWETCRVLLVDEVSMLDAILFDKLDYIAKTVRNCPVKPFGGIQLIMVGDFYQLPPVVSTPNFWGPAEKQREMKDDYNNLAKTYTSRFVFHAKQWKRCIPRTIVLKTVFRQADPKFVKMLDETRRAKLSQHTIQEYLKLARDLDVADGILPTELFPTRAQVSNANEGRLRALPGELHTYTSRDISYVHELDKMQPGSQMYTRTQGIITEFLDRAILVGSKCELRVGAQVMLVKNMSNGLVNGSRGIVTDFIRVDRDAAVVKNEFGNAYLVGQQTEELARAAAAAAAGVKQDPDAVAHAKLEHGHSAVKGEPGAAKAEPGSRMSMEQANANRARAQAEAHGVDFGMAAAAAAGGAAGGDGGIEIGVAAGKKSSAASLVSREGLEHVRPGVAYPVVQFVNGQKVLIAPVQFDIESHVGKVEMARIQVPLILAWSMSIHKAQGQTLDKVKVNLARTFENGQAYVALSRATHLEGIQVLGFHPSAVKMNKHVAAWEEEVGVAESEVWSEYEKLQKEIEAQAVRDKELNEERALRKANKARAREEEAARKRAKKGKGTLDAFTRGKF